MDVGFVESRRYSRKCTENCNMKKYSDSMLLGNPGIEDLLGTFSQDELSNFTNSIMNNSDLSSPVSKSWTMNHFPKKN